jgi:hypothetical protein
VSGQRQKIKGIWRKTMYDSSKDNLIPITEIADNLGLVFRKHDFSEEDYIPITMIPIKKLFSDRKYQRLLNEAMIKKAGRFCGNLCRPLAVFERPDGKLSVSDGQHTSTIGYLYTNQSGDLCVPCQVIVHPIDRTLEECVACEAKYFEDLNKNRTNVGAVETLRSGIAYGNKESLETEQKLISMGVHIENIGDPYGYEVSGLTRILEAYNVSDDLKYAKKAIDVYSKLIQESNTPNWTEVPMLGSLISGLARVWCLRDSLGKGDKGYVVCGQVVKTKVLKHYAPFMPINFDTYYEPFFGGGAMFVYVNEHSINHKTCSLTTSMQTSFPSIVVSKRTMMSLLNV